MSASSTRIAVAAILALLFALAGGLGWHRMRPSSSAHVEMLASMPLTTSGSPAATDPVAAVISSKPPSVPAREVLPPRAAASDVKAENEIAPKLSAGINTVDSPRIEPVTPPSFDIVRVEPSGDALLAGRSKPDSTVALLDRGKVVAEAKADAGGNFVMTPPALKPGDYALSLREGQGAAAQQSKQSVVVSVPPSKMQQVVVALSEPGKATTLLSAPPDPVPAAPTVGAKEAASPPKLAIQSVELENGSGLFASGTAPPGTDVRVYLNDSRVADVIAAAAGAWTVEVRKGLIAGRYAVRADSLRQNQNVEARVEVPFDVPMANEAKRSIAGVAAREVSPANQPAEVADAKPQSQSLAPKASAGGMPSKSAAVVDQVQTEMVTRGDNLWHISRERLGRGTRYTEIYAANVTQIRDPKLIYPGQVFVLPHN